MHREFHVMAEKNIKLFEYVYGNRMYLNLNKKTPGAQKTPGADWCGCFYRTYSQIQ